MKPVELEIKTFKGEKMTAVIELPDGITSKKTLEVASELLTICKHWKQVRVGIGSHWSQWIKPNTQLTQR